MEADVWNINKNTIHEEWPDLQCQTETLYITKNTDTNIICYVLFTYIVYDLFSWIMFRMKKLLCSVLCDTFNCGKTACEAAYAPLQSFFSGHFLKILCCSSGLIFSWSLGCVQPARYVYLCLLHYSYLVSSLSAWNECMLILYTVLVELMIVTKVQLRWINPEESVDTLCL